MVKFTDRFEKHKEIIKAIYIPKNLHLTIFHDERFSKDKIRGIVWSELVNSNLMNSVDTLSIYPETLVETKDAMTCDNLGGTSDKKTGKCRILFADGVIYK